MDVLLVKIKPGAKILEISSDNWNPNQTDIEYVIFDSYINFKKYFYKVKPCLKNDCKIMLDENIVMTYFQYYHNPLAYILGLFMPLFFYCDLYDELRVVYNLKVIDVYRIESCEIIPTFPIQSFLLTLELK